MQKNAEIQEGLTPCEFTGTSNTVVTKDGVVVDKNLLKRCGEGEIKRASLSSKQENLLDKVEVKH